MPSILLVYTLLLTSVTGSRVSSRFNTVGRGDPLQCVVFSGSDEPFSCDSEKSQNMDRTTQSYARSVADHTRFRLNWCRPQQPAAIVLAGGLRVSRSPT